MLRLIIALIVIAGLWAALARLRRLPPAERKRLLWKLGLWGTALVLFALVATGRAHWLFAVLGALLPLAKIALGLGLQLFPLWKSRRQKQADTPPRATMDLREAMDTLGLKGEESELNRDRVIEAHRKLIQKLHPDRGGNNYLAARVNEAKERLLDHLG